MLDACNTEFKHEMTIQRIYESPRVTKPYREEQWKEIQVLGHLVDANLRAGDVRLTMGGEPTFISLDDADGDEWTREALGPAKRKLAVELLIKLRDHFAPRCAAALRAGQMVSRGAAAAMGVLLLLAQGRSGHLGEYGANRRGRERLWLHGRGRAQVSRRADPPAASGRLFRRCRRTKTASIICGKNGGCR